MTVHRSPIRQLARRTAGALAVLLAAGLVAASPAAAHPHHDHARMGGWLDGFLHPFVGLDHLAAMIAVGAIAALAFRSLPIWSAPAAFVAAMVAGGATGFAGTGFGGIEMVIAASVLVGGLILLAAKQAPLGWWLLPLVAVAGAAHGNAHGLEAPAAAAPVAYVVGFVLATAVLHAAGAIVGFAMRRFDLGRIVGGLALAVFGITLVAAA
jgi:urease accessory protein